jgi:TatD DNase family protein
MELIDIGVNLTHRSFVADRNEVIRRASDVGVRVMVVTGTDLKASLSAYDLARKHPGTLFSTAGVHPHNARKCDPGTIESLRELASRDGVVAIGECGLDFNRDFSPRSAQEKCFEAQIQLACELKKPLFLHERDAHLRFIEILREYRPNISAAVVHCFTGSAEELKAYLDMDFHVGITGWICDERRGLHLRELIRHIPLNRLMLETDAPFLTPRNISPRPRDGRNEPAFLIHVLKAVAEGMRLTVEEVAAATTRTTQEFFSIPQTT